MNRTIYIAASGLALVLFFLLHRVGAIGFATAPLAVMCLTLALAMVTDLAKGRIPHPYSIAIMITGFANAAAMQPVDAFLHYPIGAMIGFLSLYAVNHLYAARRGAPGMGGGDMMLAAGIGAWGGWGALPFVFLVATGTAACLVLALAVVRPGALDGRDSRLKFAPFLGAGFILFLLRGAPYHLPYI